MCIRDRARIDGWESEQSTFSAVKKPPMVFSTLSASILPIFAVFIVGLPFLSVATIMETLSLLTVSNDKVSIMVATDRKGNPTMKTAKIGRIDADSVENTIGGFFTAENVLCSDSHPSILAWAKGKKLEHHTFVASRQHIKDKCYHVQHVNSIDNLYERWIRKFNGVSTKYLAQYLNWFVFLEKAKKSSTKALDLAKNVASDISSIKTYRSIQ